MNQIFYLLLIFANLIACKQIPSQQIAKLYCDNPVSNEQMNVALCLPNNNFEIEKSENHFTLNPKSNYLTDLEMIISMSDKKVYSRTLLHFKGTFGYLLDANGLTHKLSNDTQSDILSLFKTFRISGPPSY